MASSLYLLSMNQTRGPQQTVVLEVMLEDEEGVQVKEW